MPHAYMGLIISREQLTMDPEGSGFTFKNKQDQEIFMSVLEMSSADYGILALDLIRKIDLTIRAAKDQK